MTIDYCRDPEEIFENSLSIIGAEVDLSGQGEAMSAVIIRMIHACGMVDIVPSIEASGGAAEAGVLALRSGDPVVCDSEMVERGITRRLLPAENRVVCPLSTKDTASHARAIGNTRSAAGMALCADLLPGSVVVIGNAPTALFRLLEMMDEGLAPPALILGFPVGFVGAAESKEALIARSGGVPFITLTGRRGGSAIAAAALNALAREAGRRPAGAE
jgi:precorrin-8X/cobalt-precorrin-8 methylmutase